jgi:hypothetical protein
MSAQDSVSRGERTFGADIQRSSPPEREIGASGRLWSASSVLEEHTEKTYKEVHRDREVTWGHEKRCGDDIGRRSPKRALVLVQGYQAGEDSSASGVLVRRV